MEYNYRVPKYDRCAEALSKIIAYTRKKYIPLQIDLLLYEAFIWLSTLLPSPQHGNNLACPEEYPSKIETNGHVTFFISSYTGF